MVDHTTRRRFLQSGAVVTGIALAGCAGEDGNGDGNGNGADPTDEPTDEPEETEDAPASYDASYEVWALDQGTDIIYTYEPTEDREFEITDEIVLDDLDDIIEASDYVPHMIDFTADYEYAAVACTGGAQTLVFRTADHELVAALDTGAGSHFAGFTPDDQYIHVDVIGEGSIKRIDANLEDEAFEITETIELIEADAVQDHEDEFESANPICHDYTGEYSYHTLGPSVDGAGLVVFDWEGFEIEKVYSKEQLRTNCGTMAHPNGDKFYLTAGAPSNHEPTGGVGEYYILDTEDHRPYDPDGNVVDSDEFETESVSRDSDGYDAHGFWFTPDNDELWVLNRETDNGLVLDPETDEVIDTIDDYGPAPDIIWGSPDGEYMFVTLRGPQPQSGDPHAAEGEIPGFSVMNVETREQEQVIAPDAENEDSDFHGIGVRPL